MEKSNVVTLYRLILTNSQVQIDILDTDVPKLMELIKDERLRWTPVPVGVNGDLLVPAHVVIMQRRS